MPTEVCVAVLLTLHVLHAVLVQDSMELFVTRRVHVLGKQLVQTCVSGQYKHMSFHFISFHFLIA